MVNNNDPLKSIGLLSLELLLHDQLKNGSWGKSTIDYCFLSTREESWKPCWGSITQTAWALLGLTSLSVLEKVGKLNSAIKLSENYVNLFISDFMDAPDSGKATNSFDRHVATVLLAEVLLDETIPAHERSRHAKSDLFTIYPHFLNRLTERLNSIADDYRSIPTDHMMLAIYPLVVQTLIGQESSHFLKPFVDIWRSFSPGVNKAALKVLRNSGPEKMSVLSRTHLWAALLELSEIISKGHEKSLAEAALSLNRKAKSNTKNIIKEVNLDQLPYMYHNSFYEPWSLLALSLCHGKDMESFSCNIADTILNAFRSKLSPKESSRSFLLGGCTHIWSIIVRKTLGKVIGSNERKESFFSSPVSITDRYIQKKLDYQLWPKTNNNILACDQRIFEVFEASFKENPKRIGQDLIEKLLSFYRV